MTKMDLNYYSKYGDWYMENWANELINKNKVSKETNKTNNSEKTCTAIMNSDNCSCNISNGNIADSIYDALYGGSKCKGKSKYLNIPAAYQPKYIHKSGDVTVVHWMDETETVVRFNSSDSTSSDFNAFTAALAKKIYGSTNAIHKQIEQHQVEYINAKKKELAEKNRKIAEQKAKTAYDRKLRKEAKRLKMEMEARNMAEEMIKRDTNGI